MAFANPAKLRRISGPEAVVLTHKNLKSAAWATVFGLILCAGHTYGLHGWWQYIMLATAGYGLITHLWIAWYYWRRLKTLQQGGEVTVSTDVPRKLTHTPWIVDFVVVFVLSMFVLPFVAFPMIIFLGAYVWWEKALALLFASGAGILLILAWKKVFAGRLAQICFDNALWRLKALSAVPHLQKYIAQENSIPELWITLNYFFEKAYEPETHDDRLIRDIYAYAEWCMLSSKAELPEDEARLLKAGAIAFYESAAQSPLAGSDCINHVSQAVRAELAPGMISL